MIESPRLRLVGRVAALWRYPVKSMAGEALSEVDVSWNGLAGDRRWAFVRDNAKQSGFPWLTLRDRGDLNQYRPSFLDPGRPDQSATIVRTPSEHDYDVADAALASELYPAGARALRSDRGIFDTFPLSMITTQTIEELGRAVGKELEVQRFRPNILVEAAESTPFLEDGWVGKVLRVGRLRMRADKRDGRCMVITNDPATAVRDPQVLGRVVDQRQGCLGIYGTTVEPGRVATDDSVWIESSS